MERERESRKKGMQMRRSLVRGEMSVPGPSLCAVTGLALKPRVSSAVPCDSFTRSVCTAEILGSSVLICWGHF